MYITPCIGNPYNGTYYWVDDHRTIPIMEVIGADRPDRTYEDPGEHLMENHWKIWCNCSPGSLLTKWVSLKIIEHSNHWKMIYENRIPDSELTWLVMCQRWECIWDLLFKRDSIIFYLYFFFHQNSPWKNISFCKTASTGVITLPPQTMHH